VAITIQKDATIYSLFITVNCSTWFGWYLHPSSRVHITVSDVIETVTATCREHDWTGAHAGGSNDLINVSYCRYRYMSSWWWVEIPPEIYRAVYRHKYTAYCCILLDNYWPQNRLVLYSNLFLVLCSYREFWLTNVY